MNKKILYLFSLLLCLSFLTACNNEKKEDANIPVSVSKVQSSGDLNSLSNINENNSSHEEIKYTEIKVSSAKDIFQNVKPYTRIVLTDDYYNLSEIDPTYFKSENAYLEDCFDGYEFVIHDIDHFEICSSNDVMAEIVTEAPHVNVISLKNCKDVKIDGIVAGHAVEKGYCTGGVINIENSSQITIENCHLYGCGIYGIVTSDSENIHVSNSEIYECSYGLLDLNKSKNIAFENCTFRDSEEYDMLCFYQCNQVKFNNCVISGNRCINGCTIIANNESSDVSFTKCIFKDNLYDYLVGVDDVEMIGCKVDNQNYEEEYYPDYDYDYEYDYDYDYDYEDAQ